MVDPGGGLSAPSYVFNGASLGTNLNFSAGNFVAMLVEDYEMSRARKSAIKIPHDHFKKVEDALLNNIFGNI